MINLKNLNILVTGGTGGIGSAIVDKLNNLGANVLVTGSNQEKLNSISDKFKNVKIIQQDISDHSKLESFVDNCVLQFDEKKIDVLINNAGITKDNLTIRMSAEEWTKVIDINLTSTFLISKFMIKKMLKNKTGKIINITSVVGHTGNIGQPNYTASKAAITAMSKSMALEYGKKNITVNCIAPGFIETAMTDKINEEYKNILKSKIPLERFGLPVDIANCVAFLSSEHSNYITGETIHINGGMYFS